MKKVTNYVIAALCVGSLAFSAGSFMKVNAATSATATTPGQPVDLTFAAEKALPAVVHIKYVQNSKVKTVDVESDPFGGFFDPFGFFGNPGQGGTRKQQVQTPKREATGSGVIISSDGYIVTTNHVVEGADELTVTLNDNREFSARIIGTDKTTDLALIKIEGKNLPTLPIANSDNVKVGEWVIAVGNPFGLNNTVTAGIISAKARTLGANGVESFIQTDAAINAGNSGGALVNTQGELVGINAMLYSQTGSYAGYGFAIPTSIMNKVVDDIKKYGSVQRVMLSIQGSDVLNYINAQKENGKEVDLGTNEGVYSQGRRGRQRCSCRLEGRRCHHQGRRQEGNQDGRAAGDSQRQASWRQDEHHLPAQQEDHHQDHHLEECPGQYFCHQERRPRCSRWNLPSCHTEHEGSAQHQVWRRSNEGKQRCPEGCRYLSRIHHPAHQRQQYQFTR